MQELVTGVIFQLFSVSHVYHFSNNYTIIFIISLLSLFLYFQGLNLLELAAHLEEKAAQLRHKGLGQIKIALAGTVYVISTRSPTRAFWLCRFLSPLSLLMSLKRC